MQWGVVIPVHRVTLGVIANIIRAARRVMLTIACIVLLAIATAIPGAPEALVATATAVQRARVVVPMVIAVPQARPVAVLDAATQPSAGPA